ncbi:FAD-dependent oxidoreductase [Candidatus Parcubacteria bacterium]|nr:FAD-dependent oxidoreductase [Candidatus Parcubacteria bacterium]
MENYDLIIIGGSAAATSAGVYAARRGLNFKIITKEFGGEVATSGEIENWPGIYHTDGLSLAQQFKDHLHKNNVTPEEGVWVSSVTRQEDGMFCISVNQDGETMAMDKVKEDSPVHKCDYVSKSVIIATGVHPRLLKVPGEQEYRNKGVTYCTTCDGPLFQDKITTVIGGGNSALEAALMLADIASKVYIINKNPQFKGEKVLIDNVQSKKNVEILYSAKTSEIVGEDFVTGVRYIDKDGQMQDLKTEGVFIHIGMVPNSSLVPDDVAKNDFGEIKVDANCATNMPGLFAAGDVTNVPFKQIVIAAGQGCIAALSAVQYLNRKI